MGEESCQCYVRRNINGHKWNRGLSEDAYIAASVQQKKDRMVKIVRPLAAPAKSLYGNVHFTVRGCSDTADPDDVALELMGGSASTPTMRLHTLHRFNLERSKGVVAAAAAVLPAEKRVEEKATQSSVRHFVAIRHLCENKNARAQLVSRPDSVVP